MRRWLDMIATGQSVRRIAVDAGMHVAAGLVDFLPRMKQRMARLNSSRIWNTLAMAATGCGWTSFDR